MSCFFRWNLITIDRTFWGPVWNLLLPDEAAPKPRCRIAFFFRLHIPTPAACDNDKFKMQTPKMGKNSQVYTCEPTFSRGGSLFHILFFKHTPGSLKVCHSKWPFIYSWFIYEKVGDFPVRFLYARGYVGYLWISWLRWLIFLGWVETAEKNTLKSFRCHRQGLSTLGWLWERNGLQRLFQALAIMWTALHLCQT